MTNLDSPSDQPNSDVFADFERQLQGRSLGPGPSNRSEILYQCGFAAGLASATQSLPTKQHIPTASLRWQQLSLAALVLLSISLSLHGVHYMKSMKIDTPPSHSSIVAPSSIASQLPHRASFAESNRSQSPRPRDWIRYSNESTPLFPIIQPLDFNSAAQTLQPNDVQRFLQGEV